jgi:hypothetical protein
VVQGFSPACPAETLDRLAEKPVGTVLLAWDPEDLQREGFFLYQFLNFGTFPYERMLFRPVRQRQVPDHDLAVGLYPGMCMIREVNEGEDDSIELCLVV